MLSLTTAPDCPPWLDQLSEQIGQTYSASILDGIGIVYLARAAQRHVISIGLMPGSRLPAHCTSMGRVLLAALPEPKSRQIIDASDLTPPAANMLSHRDELMAKIAKVRVPGSAVVNQEVEIGLSSVAVPLVITFCKTVAALNTGMAAASPTSETMLQDYLQALLKVQESLKRMLS